MQAPRLRVERWGVVPVSGIRSSAFESAGSLPRQGLRHESTSALRGGTDAAPRGLRQGSERLHHVVQHGADPGRQCLSNRSHSYPTSWLTSDEKTFLVSELARVQSGNSCAALTVQSYRVADLINGQVFDGGLTGSCGGGGYAILWGKVSGTWKVLVTGQNPPGCADIRTAGWASTIPKDFFGGQCYEKGSTTLVAYKP
jgi:hypothetical protein